MSTNSSPAGGLAESLKRPPVELRADPLERYYQLVSLMPAGVYTCDADGRINFYNRRAAELWGREPETTGSERFCACYKVFRLDGTYVPPHQTPMAVAIREGKAFRNVEARVERPDGSRFVAAVNIDPLWDKDGKLYGAINVFQDITERKQAEERLRESEGRFRSIFNQTTVGIAQVDLDGHFVLVNQRFCEITGYPAEDLRKKSCRDLTHPGDLACDGAAFEKAAQEGRPYAIEKRYVRPDGSPVWVRNHVSQMTDADGEARGMLAVAVDISEQKCAQEGAARLAAIVEYSDDAIFSTDLDGTIQSWNGGAERLYGFTAAEVIGESVTLLLPEGRVNEEPEILRRIRRGESVENYETERRCRNGSVIGVSLTVSPVKDPSGNVVGASKVARDITDKIRAREMLEQTVAERTASLREAVAQMEEFSYSVSHDLRAPLRAMRAYAGVLLEDYGEKLDANGRGYLEKIHRSCDRMDRLTLDVLTYSRVARTQVQLEPIALEPFVKDIIADYSYLQTPAAHIEIATPLLDVLGHEATLGQCIANLLSNAVKFVSPGSSPRVRLRTERRGKKVRVWFEDNGIGISPQYHERVFQMFERVHPEGHYEGTGIGLTIVRKAVEKMGGKVGVESDGRNGSRFWIELCGTS